MTEPVKIAIIIAGGCLLEVISAGVPVDFVLIDYDTDADDPDARWIPQGERRKSAPAQLNIGSAVLSEDASADVLRAFELATA